MSYCPPAQELKVRRTWDAVQHPQWLAFEVEGQLQIRPAQHSVAQHLMANPGDIAQLNMGEGKTRVILPMLVLHWADGSRVVRGRVGGWEGRSAPGDRYREGLTDNVFPAVLHVIWHLRSLPKNGRETKRGSSLTAASLTVA